MRIYVAGGSDERLMVREFIDSLTAAGHVVMHDWTRCEGYERAHTDEERLSWAAQNLDGVLGAHVIWLMAPAEKSEGAATELGIALAARIPILVSGRRARGNIFSLFAAETFELHGDALAALLKLAPVKP